MMTLEEALVTVWRGALVDGARRPATSGPARCERVCSCASDRPQSPCLESKYRQFQIHRLNESGRRRRDRSGGPDTFAGPVLRQLLLVKAEKGLGKSLRPRFRSRL